MAYRTIQEIVGGIADLEADPWGWNGVLVKQTETDAVIVVPALFNDRVILVPLANTKFYDFGWCYDRAGHLAVVAALAWDPDAEPEPVGFKKRIAAWGPRTLR